MAWDSKRRIDYMDIGACFTGYIKVERANGRGTRQERLICSYLLLHHNKKKPLGDKLKYPNCIKKSNSVYIVYFHILYINVLPFL